MSEHLIELYSVPEIFVDNFSEHSARDGIMSCVGYRKMPEGNVIVVRLVWPVVNTHAAIGDAIEAMREPVPKAITRRMKRDVH